jgi:hypothetical protein
VRQANVRRSADARSQVLLAIRCTRCSKAKIPSH